jgi:hypothetical protein
MLRKFYDADASDTKAAEPKFGFGESFDFQTDTENGEQIEESNDNGEGDKEDEDEEKVIDKEEEKIEAKEEEKDEKVEKIEEKKEEVKTPAIQDWKESVKKADNRKEIFQLLEIDEEALNLAKELNSDSFVKQLVAYRKEHGNVSPFLEAATKDYDKISPEQLIMDDLQKQYSHLPSDKAAKLAKSDFNQRFIYKDDINLTDEENAEMADLTAIKLESEGLKIRAARKAEQQTFLDSVKPVDRTAEAEKVAQEQAAANKAELEKFSSMYNADPITAKLITEKKIVLGGDEPVNYTVNPDSIKEQTFDTNKFYGKFWTEKDGKTTFNADHWNRVIAYSENPAAFETALINHGRSLENKIIDEELENAKEKTDKTNVVKKDSLAKSVANGKAFSFNGEAVN